MAAEAWKTKEFARLKSELLAMGRKAEGMVKKAIQGLVEHKDSLSRLVIDLDATLDQMEVKIDNLCIDLFDSKKLNSHETRTVACGMKIVADLERIGDLAVDISRTTVELNQQPALKPYITLPKMADRVQKMLEESLHAYVDEDVSRAYAVIREQEEIEGYSREIFDELVEFMARDIFSIYRSTRLLAITRFLERIGAHAANTAEMVVLMVQGEDVRHQRKG